MPAPANLKRRISIAFQLDEQALVTSIYTQRLETWRSTLTEEARAIGSPKSGRGPDGADRSELSRMSRADAASIVQTFRRDLERQIDQVYDQFPGATRTDYVQALRLWADDRATWKDRQIANQTRATTRSYAQQRFNAENAGRIAQAKYLFVGPPPREAVCAGHFARGVVDQKFVDANPTPIHINCPHDWQKVTSRTLAPADLWVG